MTTIHTIGHSTRTVTMLADALKANGIDMLCDIRSYPGSRHVPEWNRESLEVSVPKTGLGYMHLRALGGRRATHKDSTNTAWRNASFRGYADYMQTPEFDKALGDLLLWTKKAKIAIMCAEAVPWRCHRSLVTDALIARGVAVYDIIDLNASPKLAKIKDFAVITSQRVTYPGEL